MIRGNNNFWDHRCWVRSHAHTHTCGWPTFVLQRLVAREPPVDKPLPVLLSWVYDGWLIRVGAGLVIQLAILGCLQKEVGLNRYPWLTLVMVQKNGESSPGKGPFDTITFHTVLTNVLVLVFAIMSFNYIYIYIEYSYCRDCGVYIVAQRNTTALDFTHRLTLQANGYTVAPSSTCVYTKKYIHCIYVCSTDIYETTIIIRMYIYRGIFCSYFRPSVGTWCAWAWARNLRVVVFWLL